MSDMLHQLVVKLFKLNMRSYKLLALIESLQISDDKLKHIEH